MRHRLILAAAGLSTLVVGVPQFETVQPGLLATGGSFVNAFADIDADGDLDLFVGFNGAPNRLYRNDSGRLTDIAVVAGVADARPTRAAAWGDFDADGDPDLLVGFTQGADSVLRLYQNTSGKFRDVTAAAGLPTSAGAVRQTAWVDVDDDGDLDLFVAFRDRANALYRNTDGAFTDYAPAVGVADSRRSVGAVWFDYEEDGDLDLLVGNMDGDANGLYRNEGGKFTDVAETAGVAGGGRAVGNAANGTVRPCAADVNGDGLLDLFFANYGPNGLFLNRGGGRFEDVSAAWGIAIDGRYDACAFADIDHDGRMDLYVNGTVTGGKSYPDSLFVNAGTKLDEATPPLIRELEADHGVQWADFDRDGDLDLSLTGSQPTGMHLILRNRLDDRDAKRSLHVTVVDARGRAIRAGAEVRVYESGSRRLLGARLVDSGSGYNAQNDMPASLGFAARTPVEVEVVWPGSGRRNSARQPNVLPNGQVIRITVASAR